MRKNKRRKKGYAIHTNIKGCWSNLTDKSENVKRNNGKIWWNTNAECDDNRNTNNTGKDDD